MKSLNNLNNLEIVTNTNTIKGGKRTYGLVKVGSTEYSKFMSSNSLVTSMTMVKPNVLQLKNAQGDDICVEW